jgi:hypothetical protein
MAGCIIPVKALTARKTDFTDTFRTTVISSSVLAAPPLRFTTTTRHLF